VIAREGEHEYVREVAAELVLEPFVRALAVVRDDAGAVREQERRAPAYI
jgi:hypothetical protein